MPRPGRGGNPRTVWFRHHPSPLGLNRRVPALNRLLDLGRTIRAIGFDDAPFNKETDATVAVGGVVCAGTRMEGMVWGEATRDGNDATEVIANLLLNSKFAAQVHVVLIDGLAVGGMNLVDLPALAERLQRPCIAVMRRLPNLPAMEAVIARFPDADRRLHLLRAAGPIHTIGPTPFQVAGCTPEIAARVLRVLGDRGVVPEALRLAHLIGGAVKRGQSGKRA